MAFCHDPGTKLKKSPSILWYTGIDSASSL